MGKIFAVMTQDLSLATSGNQWEEDQEQWTIPSTILFGNLGHNQLWLFHYFLTKLHIKKWYFNIGADDLKKIICYLFESDIPYANMNISFVAS